MKLTSKFLLGGAAALAMAAAANTGQAAECGSITIAEMNWPSAEFIANVDKLVLELGYDCTAELVPGDTMPTGTSMTEKAEPDIAPEFWTNAMKDVLDKAVDEGRLAYAGQVFADGGEEAFWIPKYMVDKNPELANIDGIRANPQLFPDPENPDQGYFMGCPSGWACQISAGNNFRALGMEDAGFVLGDPGSAAGLDGSLAKAYDRGEAWFGYYWAPTALLGKFEMVKVDINAGQDVDYFQACITQAECEPERAVEFPPAPVYSVTTAAFKENSPEAFSYIQGRNFRNKFLNTMLAWMDENQADGETAAIEFLETREDLWTPWVSAEVAEKIKSGL